MLIAGVPVNFLSAWIKSWSRQEIYEIFEMFSLPSYSSIRTENQDKLIKLLEEKNIRAFKSDISKALRLNESVLPVNLPGFNEGLCSVRNRLPQPSPPQRYI